MPEYRRIEAPRASIFFTVVTHQRRPILTSPGAVDWLRQVFRDERSRHPFEIDAIVILPDHLHAIWTLPPGDSRFSMRWSNIKRGFTDLFLAGGGADGPRSASRVRHGERGVWQRRFWDHVVRDDGEYGAFMDYIHWNPVKHDHARCPHAWPHSSFRNWVLRGSYAMDWMCVCGSRWYARPRFDLIGDYLDYVE